MNDNLEYVRAVKIIQDRKIRRESMNNLKRHRNWSGMSQSQLAEASGVNLRMIQYYEQGAKDINKAEALTVWKLAQALKCDVGDLLEI